MKHLATFLCFLPGLLVAGESSPPNIVFILADDLGYGDIACYNPESKIPTPNIDRLAREGMLFTDAHSPSTVCTPTRYSVLTGRMAFRTGMSGVFTGAGGPFGQPSRPCVTATLASPQTSIPIHSFLMC
jgi:arylsulfatase A-like enzyme